MESPGETIDASQDSVATIVPSDRHEILYFAYGSNLSSTQMLARCPSSTPVALARLRGWRWLINSCGYANVVWAGGDPGEVVVGLPGGTPPAAEEAEVGVGFGGGKGKERATDPTAEMDYYSADGGDGSSVPVVYGVLYLLPPDDEAALDVYEGVPSDYEKMHISVDMAASSSSQSSADSADGFSLGRLGGGGTGFPLERIEEGAELGVVIAPDSQDGGPAAGWEWQTVRALVYVDRQRKLPGPPKEEYIFRMNRAIAEAEAEWRLPTRYVDGVMRPFIPRQAVVVVEEEVDDDSDSDGDEAMDLALNLGPF